MKKSINLIAAAASVVLAFVLNGCDNPVNAGPTLTMDEVNLRIESLQEGELFELYLTDLVPEDRERFLASIGRPGDDPSDYAGVPITYMREHGVESRAARSACSTMVRLIGHISGCWRPGYRYVKTTIPNYGRCSHAGYTEVSPGYQKTSSCTNKKCTYENTVTWFYHSPI